MKISKRILLHSRQVAKRFAVAFLGGLCAILMLFSFVVTPSAYAADACSQGDFLGFPKWNRGLTCDTTGTPHIAIDQDAGGIPKFVWTIVLNAIDILLRIAGILAVIMILVSAFKYLTNSGSEEKIRGAKTALMQAVVGLAIAIAASTIISFVVGGLQGA